MDNWQEIRLQVLDRDCFQCVNCGATKRRLSIHHVDGSGNEAAQHKYSNNNLGNLMALCNSCHPKIHKKRSINPNEIDRRAFYKWKYPHIKFLD